MTKRSLSSETPPEHQEGLKEGQAGQVENRDPLVLVRLTEGSPWGAMVVGDVKITLTEAGLIPKSVFEQYRAEGELELVEAAKPE